MNGKLALTSLDRYRDLGLLVLRVGIGVMFIAHGWKVFAGPEVLARIGGAMAIFGLDFAPTFWGLLGKGTELVGGMLLILGLLTRPAAFFLLCTMIVATAKHLVLDDYSIMQASHAIEAGILFLSLILIGAGRYSLDHRIFGARAIDP